MASSYAAQRHPLSMPDRPSLKSSPRKARSELRTTAIPSSSTPSTTDSASDPLSTSAPHSLTVPAPSSSSHDAFISLSPLSLSAPRDAPVGAASMPTVAERSVDAMEEDNERVPTDGDEGEQGDENAGSAMHDDDTSNALTRTALTVLSSAHLSMPPAIPTPTCTLPTTTPAATSAPPPPPPPPAVSPEPSSPVTPTAAASPAAFVVPVSPFSPFSPFATPPRHSRAATALISPSFSSHSPRSPALSPPSFSVLPGLSSRYARKLQTPPRQHSSPTPVPVFSPHQAAVEDLLSDAPPSAKKHRRSATEDVLVVRSHVRSLTSVAAMSPLPATGELSGRSSGGTISPTLFQALHVDTTSHYSDRFIPSRRSSALEPSPPPALSGRGTSAAGAGLVDAVGAVPETKEESPAHELMMRTELLGHSGPGRSLSPPGTSPHTAPSGSPSSSSSHSSPPPRRPSRTFRYKSPKKSPPLSSPYSLSPLSHATSSSPPTLPPPRKIPKNPQRVLDAPALKDDFYLNLVDWSSQNVVAVGLGSSVYLWSGVTGVVTRLCDLGEGGMGGEAVTSVGWAKRGRHLAVGTKAGEVQVWDVERHACIRTLRGHSSRVGCVAWTSSSLASGSRDKAVLLRDLRASDDVVQRFIGHKQEVCGLKWAPDDAQLASGGNDNKLFLWSPHSPTPQHVFTEHVAAVKAIAWSPHQRHLLASGGGTADRHIRFFNTATHAMTSAHDTGSQVCNLTFSRTSAELLSTHGYSLNQMIVWKLPSMQPIATLTGHTYRVLYLALSPDGQTAVTGAGDETLRFWNVFPSKKKESEEQRRGIGGDGVGGADRRGRAISVIPNTGQMR